jgi:hypothetical protein
LLFVVDNFKNKCHSLTNQKRERGHDHTVFLKERRLLAVSVLFQEEDKKEESALLSSF